MVAMLEGHQILKFMCIATAKYTKTLQCLQVDALDREKGNKNSWIGHKQHSYRFFFITLSHLKCYLFLTSHLIVLPLGLSLPQLHIRYQLENNASKQKTCTIQVYIGIVWLKSCKNRKKITQDIETSAASRLKKIFSQLEKESIQAK